MKANTIFGNHAASPGCIFALMAKVEDTVWNMMYAKMSANPIPKAIPIPFFRFLAEIETPIIVRIKVAKAEAPRFQYSTSNSLILANPRAFCRSMYVFSSGMVSATCTEEHLVNTAISSE